MSCQKVQSIRMSNPVIRKSSWTFWCHKVLIDLFEIVTKLFVIKFNCKFWCQKVQFCYLIRELLWGTKSEVRKFQILMNWTFWHWQSLIHQKVQLCYFFCMTATNRDKDKRYICNLDNKTLNFMPQSNLIIKIEQNWTLWWIGLSDTGESESPIHQNFKSWQQNFQFRTSEQSHNKDRTELDFLMDWTFWYSWIRKANPSEFQILITELPTSYLRAISY